MLIRPQASSSASWTRCAARSPGDIVTTKGIVGIVVNIKDDMLLLQTGGDKTTIQVQKWAVSTVEARHEEKNGDAEK
ncbi:MAG: preprotein translocase subunit YajC [Acutalibacteraceae bacterium]